MERGTVPRSAMEHSLTPDDTEITHSEMREDGTVGEVLLWECDYFRWIRMMKKLKKKRETH